MSLTEINLFPDGQLVDELVLTQGNIDLGRTGKARYLARFTEGQATSELELWTTQKGQILVKPWPGRPPWIRLTLAQDSTLDSLTANDVDIHVEHLDRGQYFIGLSRGEEQWGLSLASDGYIKTRICGGTAEPHLGNRSRP